MQQVVFEDLGLVDYKKAWDYQEELFSRVTQSKLKGTGGLNYLLFCEHPHVYTLGKSGQRSNLLIGEEMLRLIDATYYHANRGGDITYHGPGQMVVYPIINLESFGLSLRDYIFVLEQVIISFLSTCGIAAHRLDGATGVWLDKGIPGKERKICAIGVRASRFVTMHGLAFNVNTDLNYYSYINPCGLIDKGVTSMQAELGRCIDLTETKQQLKCLFAEQFNFQYSG